MKPTIVMRSAAAFPRSISGLMPGAGGAFKPATALPLPPKAAKPRKRKAKS